jgi:hypothetical protein
MNDQARNAAPVPPRSCVTKDTESQLDLDFGKLPAPSAPDWESLPEASRIEAMTALARLLAKAGSVEEESDV